MRGRFVPVLFFCILSATVCAPALAAPPAFKALARPAIDSPLLLRTGGCGWDYPCAPDPDFGRPLYLRGGEVVIHNNYGPINVYPGDAARHEGEEEGNSEDSGRDWCGPLCWLRRLRHGYCGHGCLAYREQALEEAEARVEDAERELEGRTGSPWCEERFECHGNCPEARCRRGYAPPPPAPYYYARPQRAYRPWRGEESRPRREAPRWEDEPRVTPRSESGPAELTPRERFEGPRYPRQ
jgi:hypothetical protein